MFCLWICICIWCNVNIWENWSIQNILPTSADYPKPIYEASVEESKHGITVHDPFRWMEEHDSVATQRFIRDQNELFQRYFFSFDRGHLRKQMAASINIDEVSTPIPCGKYYFTSKKGLSLFEICQQRREINEQPTIFIFIRQNYIQTKRASRR